MNFVLPLDSISEKERPQVGGKGFALARVAKNGMAVPEALCITVEAYEQYVDKTGLRDQIFLELHRKVFEDMRWEEIWDTSLRIRNLFLKTAIPGDLRDNLMRPIEVRFAGNAVLVRSSAPGEDSSKTSFAGLHESYVNIRGKELILDHIRLVWASLWSDRALLYRKELGLDVEKSAMAVIVQEMIFSDRSGVVFGKSPVNASQALIEAVYGLNQGLVDGTVEPDRWTLHRKTGKIISYDPAVKEKLLNPASEGIRIESLPPDKRNRPPLEKAEVSEVFGLVMKAESLFGTPQDVEWTYKRDLLHTLQARPITTLSTSKDDQRPWYLSLRRGFDNLKGLHLKIEKELIPAIVEEAASLARRDLSLLSDSELSDEIEHRIRIYDKWLDIYRRDCIPFAHGMRLFGQVYNDVMRPTDPFQFIDLLEGPANMVSVKRNQMLRDMASWIRKDPQIATCLKQYKIEDCDAAFLETLKRFNEQFGDLTWGGSRLQEDSSRIVDLLLEMASLPSDQETYQIQDAKSLEEEFLSKFEGEQGAYAVELIDLARASYRLRDDDNIRLGKIEGQLMAAVEEGKRRIAKQHSIDTGPLEKEEVVKALININAIPKKEALHPEPPAVNDFQMRARQLVGQPAGPGIAFGRARVVLKHSDLFQFKAGEVLVCDAIDPNMTFVVPLASGIVERRGGMLIHGAIIAREYGLPCVTGVPDATEFIRTGDPVTVDGFLGIVIIGKADLRDAKAD